MSSVKPNQPSFGWLILGVGWGLQIGHLFGIFVMNYNFGDPYMTGWVYCLLVGAASGLGVGILVDSTAGRRPGWWDWLAFLTVSLLMAVFSLPAMNYAQ